MQILVTQDVATFSDMDAAAFAERTWVQMLGAPFNPLGGIIPIADVEELRPAFLEQATAMAKAWAADGNIDVPLTQMWVQACK